MRKNLVSLPCIDVYPSQEFTFANQDPVSGAIFLADAIWKQGQEGTITITFGTFNCSGCSVEAAWAYIGNQSTNFSSQGLPSMNLGFCDPPLTSFSMDGYTFDISEFSDATRKGASFIFVKYPWSRLKFNNTPYGSSNISGNLVLSA